MKTFEEHLRMQERIAERRERQRRKTREEQKRNQTLNRFVDFVLVLAFAVIGVALLTINAESTPERDVEPAQIVCDQPPIPEWVQEDYENEKIEAALVEQGYFREDVPLDYDTQAFLRAACEESGIEYELALAVIWKETTFHNVVGDSGASLGYMQIQPRWHGERMARLGVTDLMDPFSNFRVGCDYLSELLERYPLEQALTCYNTGRPGYNQYAEDVIGYLEDLR